MFYYSDCSDCLVVSATDPILKGRSNLTGFPSVVNALGHNSSRLTQQGVDDEEEEEGEGRGLGEGEGRVSCRMIWRAGADWPSWTCYQTSQHHH